MTAATPQADQEPAAPDPREHPPDAPEPGSQTPAEAVPGGITVSSEPPPIAAGPVPVLAGLAGALAAMGAIPRAAGQVPAVAGEAIAGELAPSPSPIGSDAAGASSLELEALLAGLEAAEPGESMLEAPPEPAPHTSSGAAGPSIALASEPAPARGAAPALQATAAPTTAELDRASEILRQLRLHLSPSLRQATIDLAPAELGRISIRLSLEEGRLVAAVRAEKHATLDQLARHLPELRASLEQHGIRTERFDLSLGLEGRGGRDASGGERRGGSPAHAGLEPVTALRAEHEPLRRALASESGVDTYA